MMKKKIKKAGKELKKEVLFNVPNSLTISRLVLAFIFIYLLFANYSKWVLFIVFIIAAFSDYLDGFFARRLKQTTSIGGRMDQVIDRVFTGLIVGSLFVYYFLSGNNYVVMLLFLTVSREIVGLPGLVVFMIRGKDFHIVRYIGKSVCWFQGASLGAIILGVNWAIYLVIPTCVIGIISGFDYIKRSFE